MNTLQHAHLMWGARALFRAGLVVLTLAALLAAATPIHATTGVTIIYVVPGGTGDGTSWAAGKDLAAALNDVAAHSNAELWVKAGTYKPTVRTDSQDARTATFALKSGVAVYGGFAGTETTRDGRNWQANVTTLSGDIGNPGDNSDNSYHVVAALGTQDVPIANTAVLDGFTISGGNANGTDFFDGGGMVNKYGNPTLTNVTFSGNTSANQGGGMYNGNSRPTLTNVTFSGNTAANQGGGMFNVVSSPTLTGVTFIGNTAQYGGGMFNEYDSNPILTNVTFSGNSAPNGYGGGMATWNASTATLINVTFSGNAASQGGGMHTYASSVTLTNVTFSGNSATQGGGMSNEHASTATIRNSILWGDSVGEIHNETGAYSSTATVSHSIVQGGYSGTGNLDADPMFQAPVPSPAPSTGGSLRLQYASPAINAGDPTITFSPPADKDLDGNARVTGGTVDMGAYESPCPSRGSIIRVNGSVSGGTGDGSSWTNAYTSLTSALGAVQSGACVEVWVATGTYKPDTTGLADPRSATFALKNNLAIYGGFAGTETQLNQRDWKAHVTTLSGDLNGDDGPNFANNGDNSYHVVTAVGTHSSAVLDGFTVSGGNASGHVCAGTGCGGGMLNQDGSPTLTNVTFSGNSAQWAGGMYNLASSPTLTNVTFSGNSAQYGGGMFNYDSNSTLTNVTFSGNSATYYGGGMYNDTSSPTLTNVTFSGNSANVGGGMYNYDSNSTLTNVTFSGNSANVGGGMFNYDSNSTLTNVTFSGNSATVGGGMYNDTSSPTLTNVTFSGNSASTYGGGMHNDTSSPTLTGVTFSGNSAQDGGGMFNANSSPTLTNVTFSGNSAQYGGGMDNWQSSPTLTNVTLSGNSAQNGGGMSNDYQSSPTLTNVTFSGNSAQNGGGMFNVQSSPTVRNSILWGDTGGEISNHPDPTYPSTATVSYSIVQGGYTGTGNLDADPKFVTAVPSPAPSTGGNLRLQAISPAINAGSNDVTDPGLPATDLDGAPRIVFNRVDMGAYEAQVVAGPTPSPAANAAGWNHSDVTVTWNWRNTAGAIPASADCPATTTSSGEGTLTLTATCKDPAGYTGHVSYTVKIDKTGPTLSGAPTTAPNAAGWYRGSVTVAWTCSDSLSGIDGSCPPNSVISSEGTNLTAQASVSDQAGNTTNVVSSPGVNIDRTKPTISAAVTSPPNAAGWYKADVTVHFTCNDGLSGIPSGACPPDQTLSGEGSAVSSTAQTVTDAAGNVSDASNIVTVQIDRTKPTISAAVTSPPNAAGWYKGDVTVHFTCNDGLSGIPTGACPPDQTLSGEGRAVSSTAQTVTDAAGNVSEPSNIVTVQIDRTKPTLNPTISPNPPILGGAATASPNASDALSGMASQSCEAVDTSRAAPHTLTCTATDNAGNTTTVAVSYSVGYSVTYVSPTVGPPGVNALSPAGLAPWFTMAKWRLTDAAGQQITTAGLVADIRFTRMVCGAAAPTWSDGFAVAGGFSAANPMYDALQNAWVFNWQLPGHGCYALLIKLSNGQVIPLLYRIEPVVPSVLGDINADGKSDLVWRNTTTGQNTAWLMDGGSVTSYPSLPSVRGAEWKVVAVGDLNADGKSDLVWRNTATGQTVAWLLDGGSVTGYTWLPTVTDTTWAVVGSGDLDANRTTDLIWRNTATGQTVAWLMDGGRVTSYAWLPSVSGAEWKLVATGDLDGDGKIDLIWRNPSSGENIAWLLDGGNVTSYAWLPTVGGQNWKLVAAGDLNGDGKSDLVWRNDATGQTIAWLMDGASVMSYAWLPTVGDQNWKLVSTGDLNADGKSDLTWRNFTTGENNAWLMDGGSVTSYAWLPTVADMVWRVISPTSLMAELNGVLPTAKVEASPAKAAAGAAPMSIAPDTAKRRAMASPAPKDAPPMWSAAPEDAKPMWTAPVSGKPFWTTADAAAKLPAGMSLETGGGGKTTTP